MIRLTTRSIAPLSALLLGGTLLATPPPAQAWWHGYRCWGGCWARPVVVPGPVVRPVVVAPPLTVVAPDPVVSNGEATLVVNGVAPAQICNAIQAVSLRTGPNQKFAVVATLTLGTPLTVLRNQVNALGQDWSLVTSAGYQGFIPTAHVCYVN